tara:strand:- start:17 stop:397 length:381 start_codon:yes stop_codon:yes gene_type:complete
MKLKLSGYHIFFILLASLIFCNLASRLIEPLENANKKEPLGVSKDNIAKGDEDKYILKSQVVPPVCPACPSTTNCGDDKKKECPPCPPCARCPEPAFECKKVPNYNATESDKLPRPVLADFSTFAM